MSRPCVRPDPIEILGYAEVIYTAMDSRYGPCSQSQGASSPHRVSSATAISQALFYFHFIFCISSPILMLEYLQNFRRIYLCVCVLKNSIQKLREI